MKNKMVLWSLICFIIGVLVWVPNVALDIASSWWLLTFIVGPIGVLLGILGKNYLLVVLNLLMTFSFFILMAFGSYFWGP
ncbi:hypothetical protein FIU87_03720 [Bacillus sp. THAF10]|uniref:hypothetical protein n=1 Tax=Bacillus sp. THAF10 TaxID=2587848 RepID=UPI0012691D9F|nr:hypothetical protein [Bacillus sp. THAF10]QFT87752.1 hypothetical protein FIU87_03720 [Bacillus sp. THAF10]